MPTLRTRIAGQVRGLVGSNDGALDLSRPPGDPGLFGPDSVAWRVHGDFTAMMAGGVAALLLQMLHPAALAGVWDHSNFRRDPHGRLKRTAQFIAGTTYGSTATAEAMIARVNRVHAHVTGTLPDGTPYRAADPHLLRWVHVAETTSFLAACLRYKAPLTPAEQDRYHAEMARLAARLGVPDVPTSRRAADAYLRSMRPELRADARTREVADAILERRTENPAMAAAGRLFRAAGLDLLPPWAAAMHGRGLAPPAAGAVRMGMQGMGRVLRWALTDGTAARARAAAAQAG